MEQHESFDLVVTLDEGLPVPTPDARSGLDIVAIARCCDQLLLRCIARPAGAARRAAGPWSLEVLPAGAARSAGARPR